MTARRTGLGRLLLFLAIGWLALTLAAPASAQVYTGGVPPIAGSSDRGTVGVAPSVAIQGADSGAGNAPVRLALTGADIVSLVAIGVVLLAVGTLAVRAGRRRPLQH